MRLSILICSIPRRLEMLETLINGPLRFAQQHRHVEVLWLGDNKRRSIGAKRNALLSIAQGDFFAFIDDDDDVEQDYLPSILAAIEDNPDADCIVFDTITYNGDTGTKKRNKVGKEYGRTETADLVTCPPTHTMVWRTSLIAPVQDCGKNILRHEFKDISQGEDVDWVDRVVPLIKKQVRIDKVLYHYHYDRKVSERP